MPRLHVVLASHEVAPVVRAGGVGRHVAFAAGLLTPVADVTVVLPSGLRPEYERLIADGHQLLGDAVVRVAERDEAHRARFASPFHADAAEVATTVADVIADRRVDLIEVDDYLGLGAVLVDAAATEWRGLQHPVLAVRLHTTWEMTQVLNQVSLTPPAARWVCALERRALRRADVLIAPGAAAGSVYERFYGRGALAPISVLAPALPPVDLGPLELPPGRVSGDTVRLLYAGRLEERKGVRALTKAVLASDHDVELVFAGGDTDTGPGGSSMRDHLEQLAGGDPRLRFAGRLEPDDLDAAYAAAHLVVVPSRFESYGYVLREALARGRPVLATPTAGFADVLQDRRAGWLAAGFDVAALGDALDRVFAERGRLEDLLATAAPRAALQALVHADTWATEMLSLADVRHRQSPVASDDATTTAVIVAAGGDLGRTLDTLEAQDGPRLEIVVVAARPSDVPAIMLERVDVLVLGQEGGALGSALAVRARRGPVLFLHAGDTLAGAGAARLRSALDAPRRPAFVTAWSAGHEARARPLGAPEAQLVADFGVAGAPGMLTADAATRASLGATDPLSWLAAEGSEGFVVPEELFGLVRRRPTTTPDEAAPRALSAFEFDRALWNDVGSGPSERPPEDTDH